MPGLEHSAAEGIIAGPGCHIIVCHEVLETAAGENVDLIPAKFKKLGFVGTLESHKTTEFMQVDSIRLTNVSIEAWVDPTIKLESA